MKERSGLITPKTEDFIIESIYMYII